MKGLDCKGLAMDDPVRLYQAVQGPFNKALVKQDSDHHQVSYLYKTLAETTSAAEFIYEKSSIAKTKTDFPQDQLGKSFEKVAVL